MKGKDRASATMSSAVEMAGPGPRWHCTPQSTITKTKTRVKRENGSPWRALKKKRKKNRMKRGNTCTLSSQWSTCGRRKLHLNVFHQETRSKWMEHCVHLYHRLAALTLQPDDYAKWGQECQWHSGRSSHLTSSVRGGLNIAACATKSQTWAHLVSVWPMANGSSIGHLHLCRYLEVGQPEEETTYWSVLTGRKAVKKRNLHRIRPSVFSPSDYQSLFKKTSPWLSLQQM